MYQMKKSQETHMGGKSVAEKLHDTSKTWPIEPVLINTPLHVASRRGHLQVAWQLMLSSYSVHDVDNVGNTPLHLSSAAGHSRLVHCFLNDGADVYARNRFQNTPYDVAKTRECREILRRAMERQNHPLDATKRLAMHQHHMEFYSQCQNEIIFLIENADHNGQHSLPMLRYHVQQAIDIGLATNTIVTAQEVIQSLEQKDELTQCIRLVKENIPIVSQDKYGLIRQLRDALRQCQTMRAIPKKEDMLRKSFRKMSKANGPFPLGGLIDIDSIVREGFQLCKSSQEEYLLNAQSLRLVSRALTINTNIVSGHNKDLDMLQDRVRLAVVSNACPQIIENAKQLYERRIAELDIFSNCLNKEAWPVMFQGDRTPQNGDDRPSKDGLDINNSHEHLGHLEQNEESLSSSAELYLWIPPKSLLELRFALQRAQEKIHAAEGHNADNELLRFAKIVVTEKAALEQLLTLKDEEDKARAISERLKAARKNKKSTRLKSLDR